LLWPFLSAGASLLEQATNPTLRIEPLSFAKIQHRRIILACCGQRRQQISRAMPVQRPNSPAGPANVNRAAGPSRTIAFQYLGKTALTAVSPISGRYYRFSQPGAIVEVDPRDRASLATVPNLRQAEASGRAAPINKLQ
jgi:hypothetical protein